MIFKKNQKNTHRGGVFRTAECVHDQIRFNGHKGTWAKTVRRVPRSDKVTIRSVYFLLGKLR